MKHPTPHYQCEHVASGRRCQKRAPSRRIRRLCDRHWRAHLSRVRSARLIEAAA
jgi:hypothetical protein